MVRYVLRSLPGVEPLEAKLRSRDENWEAGASWRPEFDDLGAEIDGLSAELFGITEDQTRFEWDHLQPIEGYEAAHRAWELNFELLHHDYDQARPVWEALGWDVGDGSGDEAHCLFYLGRQIICATKGLRGHLPDSEEALSAQADRVAEAWAARLQQSSRRR